MSKNNMNLLIIGYARHGKTESAKILKREMGFRFQDSSKAAAEIFLFDKLKEKYGYKDFKECFKDRVNRREEWFNEICEFNKEDPARLAKEIMKKANIYCGMRSDREIQKCIEDEVFDHIIEIFNPHLPKESPESFDINFDSLPKYYTIYNDSDLDTLRLRLMELIMKLNIIELQKKVTKESVEI
jgi:hypothetical protein